MTTEIRWEINHTFGLTPITLAICNIITVCEEPSVFRSACGANILNKNVQCSNKSIRGIFGVDMMPGHVCDLHTEDCLEGNRDSIGLAHSRHH